MDEMTAEGTPLIWHKVAEPDDLPDGRVRAVTAGHVRSRHACGDRYGALDNHCPHQGGPLGEGSIEKGLLRCPWHGYDYDPLTGTPPPGFSDAPACFPVEVRDDGVYVGAPGRRAARAHGLRRDGRDDGRLGRHPRVRHGRPLEPRLRRRDAPPRSAGDLTFVGIRHEGAAAFAASAYGKLTGRPAACFAIAGPGLDQPAHRPLRRQGRPRAGARASSGQVPSKVLGRGAFQDVDLNAAFADVARVLEDRAADVRPRRAHDARAQARDRRARRRAPRAPRRGAGAAVGDGPRASGPIGRVADAAIAPPAGALDDALALIARRAGR